MPVGFPVSLSICSPKGQPFLSTLAAAPFRVWNSVSRRVMNGSRAGSSWGISPSILHSRLLPSSMDSSGSNTLAHWSVITGVTIRVLLMLLCTNAVD